MKNHIRTSDGRLLQTNKRWSFLKQSQKEKIIGWFKLELSNYYEYHGKYPIGCFLGEGTAMSNEKIIPVVSTSELLALLVSIMTGGIQNRKNNGIRIN